MSQMHFGALLSDEIIHRLGHSPDLTYHKLQLCNQHEICCIYLGSLTADNQVEEWIISPIVKSNHQEQDMVPSPIESLISNILSIRRQELMNVDDCVNSILEGKCLLVPVEGNSALSYDVSKGQYRTISEPKSEAVIRGPHEGFIEDIDNNVALIRKRLKSEHLIFEKMVLGTVTKTKLYLILRQKYRIGTNCRRVS